MSNQETEIFKEVTSRTNSELILFFVLVIVAMVAVLLPLYRMIIKDRRDRVQTEAEAINTRQGKYIEREREIIKVIMANTEVMAGIKATLESSGAATQSSLTRVHSRIDEQNMKFTEITASMAYMQSTLERVIGNQTEILDTMHKTLLIVDSIPNSSNFSGS